MTFLFIFGFSNSAIVYLGTFLLKFYLGSAEVLESLNFCLSSHLQNLGYYFFKYLFFPIFSSFSFCDSNYMDGWPFAIALKLCSFLFSLVFLCSVGWIISIDILRLSALSSFILLQLMNQYWHIITK